MSHVKPFIIVGIDAFGDVGIAGWGKGKHEENERMAELKELYPVEAMLATVMLEDEYDLQVLRLLQRAGAKRNDEGAAGKGWEE
jgi:hypothetical protein